MQKKFLILSYTLFLVPFIFILNFLFDIILFEKIQGLPIFSPILFCPIGLFFALKAHKIQKGVVTYGAITVNSVLIIFPWAYMILGTALFSV